MYSRPCCVLSATSRTLGHVTYSRPRRVLSATSRTLGHVAYSWPHHVLFLSFLCPPLSSSATSSSFSQHCVILWVPLSRCHHLPQSALCSSPFPLLRWSSFPPACTTSSAHLFTTSVVTASGATSFNLHCVPCFCHIGVIPFDLHGVPHPG